jgi:hypothetical protein
MGEDPIESWDDATVLETELAYFEEHRAELRSSHPAKFVLIKGDKLLGAYATFEAAYEDGLRQIGNQAMLIRHVDDEGEFVHSVPALSYGGRGGSP